MAAQPASYMKPAIVLNAVIVVLEIWAVGNGISQRGARDFMYYTELSNLFGGIACAFCLVGEVRQLRGGAKLSRGARLAKYAQGHVPGAVNVPLGSLAAAADALPGKGDPLYVYCLSGMRSGKARSQLQARGFRDVVNAGGFRSYHGPVEVGE